MVSTFQLAAISQEIAHSASKKKLQSQEPDTVSNMINQFKAFGYEVDNFFKNSIDQAFGGGVYHISFQSQIVGGLILFAITLLWLVLVIRYFINLKNDHDWQYYYHEDERFYQKVFKYISPVVAIIPVICLLIGLVYGSGVQHKVLNNKNAYAKQLKTSDKTALDVMNEFTVNKNKSDAGFDGLDSSKMELINQKVNAGQAVLAQYMELQSNAQDDTHKSNHYILIKFTQPHFKLAAYKNIKAVSTLTFFMYGLAISSFFLLCLLAWHGNNAKTQF